MVVQSRRRLPDCRRGVCQHASVVTSDRTVVYTDGACSGNPGPGGWAWAVPEGPFASGFAAETTNQRMEITAAAEAVRVRGEDGRRIEVVSDSTYVVNCFRDRWWEGWLARGWLTSQRKPVANRDLWEPFVERVQEHGKVTFRWVKGHSGDVMNDLVDRLAVEAAINQAARAGDEPPTSVGPPDLPGAKARASTGTGSGPTAVGGKTVDGHGLLVVGHRPTELGGYGANPLADAVRDRLVEIIRAKSAMHDDLVVMTGLRLGAETLGAEAALEAAVPYVVVLPFPDPESVWPADAQARFHELRALALDTILLQKSTPETPQKITGALQRRNAWLARNAAEAVIVWDGKDDLLGRLHRSLEDHLGDDVWVVDPTELVAS
jgi:ribonuclease HI/uncharacterized phage-like protein YoqJ